jgi:hypothetical protein
MKTQIATLATLFALIAAPTFASESYVQQSVQNVIANSVAVEGNGSAQQDAYFAIYANETALAPIIPTASSFDLGADVAFTASVSSLGETADYGYDEISEGVNYNR